MSRLSPKLCTRSLLAQFLRRPRASTRAILGNEYDENAKATPSLPEPAANVDEYDKTRLKKGLLYADWSLRNKQRKVSPITAHLLGFYKATVKSALEEEWANDEERDIVLKTIVGYERDLSNNSELRIPSPDSDTTVVERLTELRRYQFAARYGDYAGHVCRKLRMEAKEHSTAYFEAITGWRVYWTDIADKLTHENRKWNRFIFGAGDVTIDMVKTSLAVSHACHYIGLNFGDTVQVIDMYAKRNALVHSSVMQMAQRELWHDLKTTLHHDLRDLPLVIPPERKDTIPVLVHIINTIIDTYFDRNEHKPDDYHYWQLKPETVRRASEMRTSAEARAKRAEKEKALIEEESMKRFEAMVDKHSYMYLAAHISGVNVPVSSIKRPLSPNERGDSTLKVRKQRSEWEGIVKVQQMAYRKFRDYLDKYGTTIPPPDPTVYLDEEFLLKAARSDCFAGSSGTAVAAAG